MSNFKGTVINFTDITPEAIGALDTMLLTRAEYDALESKSEDILYIITDEVDDKDLDIHIKDTNVHVSAEEKEKWNNVDFSAIENKVEELESKIDNQPAPYTYGTTDLEAGVTPLETGKLHFVYE